MPRVASETRGHGPRAKPGGGASNELALSLEREAC